MQLCELAEAEKARRAREDADNQLDTLAGYEVCGVRMNKGHGIVLEFGQNNPIGGCGSRSSLYWGRDLTLALTAAIIATLEDRKKAAEDKLLSLGVDLC